MDPELCNYEALGSAHVKTEDASADHDTESSGPSYQPTAVRDSREIKSEDVSNDNAYGQCPSLFDEIYQSSEPTSMQADGHEYGSVTYSETCPRHTDIKVEPSIQPEYMDDILADLSRGTDTEPLDMLEQPKSANALKDSPPHFENFDLAVSSEPPVVNSCNAAGSTEECHKCKTCGEQYRDLDAYVSHLLTHNTITTPIDKPKCKLHPCTTCQKVFTRPSHLRKHMNTHTNSAALVSSPRSKRSPSPRSASRDDKAHGNDKEKTEDNRIREPVDPQRQAQPKGTKISGRRNSQPTSCTPHSETQEGPPHIFTQSSSHVISPGEKQESRTKLSSSSNPEHPGMRKETKRAGRKERERKSHSRSSDSSTNLEKNTKKGTSSNPEHPGTRKETKRAGRKERERKSHSRSSDSSTNLEKNTEEGKEYSRKLNEPTLSEDVQTNESKRRSESSRDSAFQNERGAMSQRRRSHSSKHSTIDERKSKRIEASETETKELQGSRYEYLSRSFVHDSRCHSLGLLHPRHPSHEVKLSSKELPKSMRTMTTGLSNQQFWKFVKHTSPRDTLLCPLCPSDAILCRTWPGHRILDIGYDGQASLIDHICVYHYPFVDPLSCPKCHHRFMCWQVTKKHLMKCTAAGEPVHPSTLKQPNSFRTYEAMFNDNFIPPVLPSDIPMTGCHEKNAFQIGPFRFHLKVLEIRGESLDSIALRISEVVQPMKAAPPNDPRSGHKKGSVDLHNVSPLRNLKRTNPDGLQKNNSDANHTMSNAKRQKLSDNTAGSRKSKTVSFAAPGPSGVNHAPKTAKQPADKRIPANSQQAVSSKGAKDSGLFSHESPKPNALQRIPPCDSVNNTTGGHTTKDCDSKVRGVANVSQHLPWDHPYLREFHQSDIYNVYAYSRQQGDTQGLLPTTGKDPLPRRTCLESLRRNLQYMSDTSQKHAQIDPFTLPDRTYTPAWAARQYAREMQNMLTKLLAGTGDMVEHAFDMTSQFAYRDGMDAGARVVEGFRQDVAGSLRAEITEVRQELEMQKEVTRMRAQANQSHAGPSASFSASSGARPDPFIELTEEVSREYLQDESVPRAVRRQLYMRLYSQMTRDDTDSPEWLKCIKI